MKFDFYSIKYCYRCPECRCPVAEGDVHCGGCGVRFTSDHVATMKKGSSFTFGLMPWNTRDRYRCPKCDNHVSIHDGYCRECGVEFDENLKASMKETMRSLIRMNTPSMIMALLFAAAVILFSFVYAMQY